MPKDRKPKRKEADQKTSELRRTGTLNPRPNAVSDSLFKENPFFDPKDLLQVRYEMLRRHSVEGVSIVDVATTFGVSRPTVYLAQAGFQKGGLSGLPQAPRAQGRTQVVRRDRRVCADLARHGLWADDRWLHPSCSGQLWDHGSPPQPGTGVGEQKKTAQFGVRSLIPEGTVDARRTPPTSCPTGWSRNAHSRTRRSHAPWPGDMVPDQARGQNTPRIAFFIRRCSASPRLVWEPNSSSW